MPVLWLPEAELKALQAVFLSLSARPDPVPVDWEAYERAKQFRGDAGPCAHGHQRAAMSLTAHPLWPTVRQYVRTEAYNRDQNAAGDVRHRLEIIVPLMSRHRRCSWA